MTNPNFLIFTLTFSETEFDSFGWPEEQSVNVNLMARKVLSLPRGLFFNIESVQLLHTLIPDEFKKILLEKNETTRILGQEIRLKGIATR